MKAKRSQSLLFSKVMFIQTVHSIRERRNLALVWGQQVLAVVTLEKLESKLGRIQWSLILK
jgi:hypothetical protein